MKAVWLTVVSIGVLAGCASAPSVIPMQGGKYETTGTGYYKPEALKAAIDAAEATCKAKGLHPAVISKEETYKGSVSEEANRTADNATAVIAAVTGVVVPGMRNEDDYQAHITFACE